MSGTTLAAEGGSVALTGSNVTYVVVAAVLALVALGFAFSLVRAVLSTGKGTAKMQEIVKFGKDEEKQHPPKMDTGLLGIGEKFMGKR